MNDKKDQLEKPAAARPSSPLEQLQNLWQKMSDGERRSAEQIGVAVPRGDLAAAVRGEYKFGVSCRRCNGIALYFVGSEWEDINGEKLDFPPQVPIYKIAWTQNLPPHEIDRNSPKCQNCGAEVPLETDGSFRSSRGRICEIAPYLESRDKAFDKKHLRRFAAEVNKGGHGQIQVSPNYNRGNILPSEHLAKNFGKGIIEQLGQVAEATGLNEAVATGKLDQ